MQSISRPTVAIIGAGFGGLNAAQALANQPVDVLLIDRQNFHLFSPLLYQVATSGLDPSEIAYPVRGIFKDKPNVRFLMGEVREIDRATKRIAVQINGHTIQEFYDVLIVAGGSQTHYFGMDDLRQHAFGLKTLSDAVVLRNHILKSFERAAWVDDPVRRDALTTLVVVGGGPTGLETAGALYELYKHVLQDEYCAPCDDLKGRVILVEMLDHLLDPYPAKLQKAAYRQLEALGVEVILGTRVDKVAADGITLSDGRVIPTYTLVWSAGVKASPLAEMLDVPLSRGGRVPVRPTMQLEGDDDVYVVGDMAYLEDPDGKPYPMLIPVAKQQGQLTARNILRQQKGTEQKTFTYHDRGIMATIGRSRAVAWIFYKIPLTGFIAWLAWLGLHLITLMGFRNRLSVFLSWVWNYFTWDRSVRLILEHQPHGQYGDEEEQSTVEATGIEEAPVEDAALEVIAPR
ncbi:NAD(P)/FAD-dependent oxidoreductase [Aggregatilinea lenta]|uniref:NAD(P)/FAD-dependent oxidoreductase n=1 Tax=Aggregatilinea lenta TaxID=913108 RepID=UPI000E5B9A76|nr:NAD(P)/FAD-dependent oxidoreductase [Aggregatilinea lenta]